MKNISYIDNYTTTKMRIYSLNAKLQGHPYVINILEDMHKVSKKCTIELKKF